VRIVIFVKSSAFILRFLNSPLLLSTSLVLASNPYSQHLPFPPFKHGHSRTPSPITLTHLPFMVPPSIPKSARPRPRSLPRLYSPILRLARQIGFTESWIYRGTAQGSSAGCVFDTICVFGDEGGFGEEFLC
jgi:hypothetical protein